MSEKVQSLKEIIYIGYSSVALIIVGLLFYYVNWWALYLSVLGLLLYFPCAVWLSKRRENPRINFHFRVISIVNGAVFLFLFIFPYFLGLFR